MNHNTLDQLTLQTRRHFLRSCSLGLGGLALGDLLGARAGTDVNPLAPHAPHFPAKAKNVIFVHLSGAPPHLDMFDYKPELVKRTDQPCPDSLLKGKRF